MVQQTIFEMISRDETVEATADQICRLAENVASDALCSIVTVDREGYLHPLAGPSLPERYSAALDGIPIGPDVGSCGSAAFWRRPIAVTDIFTDHRWAPYMAIAQPLGVRACWSTPILGGDGTAIGAFAFYFRDSRGPNSQEEQIVAECIDLAALLLDWKDIQTESHKLSYTDTLSRLGNQACFEKALARASLGAGKLGLLLLNIDQLASVNKDFGYTAGDLLLREVGRRLGSRVSPGEAFRIAGGEFAVLLNDQNPESVMARIVSGIHTVMERTVYCGGHMLSPIITCGGATIHRVHPYDPTILRRQADMALRHAKETARGGFVLFNEHLGAVHKQHSLVLQTTCQALADDRIEAHYQPIIDLNTLEVFGLEALCRIRTPDGDIVPAGKLLAALQAPLLGSLITDRMIGLIAQDIRRWLDFGTCPQRVSLNVSLADFRGGDLHEKIIDAFSYCGVPLSRLMLEVVETVLLDETNRKIIEPIEIMRAKGVLIALDDFGTGYASLTHLLNFPVDVIKTDKNILDRLSPGDGGEVIIKALLDVADGLGIEIVVEGVESSAQAALLTRLGCKLAQGFLFGSPGTAYPPGEGRPPGAMMAGGS